MFLCFLILNLFACRNDVDKDLSVEESQNEPNISIIDYVPEFVEVSATLYGKVLDESGTPMSGATVKLGNNTQTTDENGRFVFKEKSMNAKGTFITVEMDGFFQGSHRFFPKENAVNYSEVILLSKVKIGSFVSSNGGLVTSVEDIQLDFPANSIIQSNGESYEGEVEVYARFIDPTAQNINEIMPGDLQGVDMEGEEVALGSFGMMAVELESTSGELLNLGNNLNATLTFPVPDELINNAPAEIPLWYFDDSFGIWVQEGKATLQGDAYVGAVAHFSFWNCDYPYPIVELSGQVLNEDGTPFAFAQVVLTMSNGFAGTGYTDGNGFFSGKVPENESFTLDLYSLYWNCISSLHTEEIGPFTEDAEIEVITTGQPGMYALSGDIVNCDNQPITNGLVEITLDNHTYDLYVDDGSFSVILHDCDNIEEITAVAINFDDLQESSVLTYTLTDPLDLGTIAACGNVLSEYLIVEIDGVTTTFNDPRFVAYPGADSTFLDAYILGPSYNFNISMDEITGVGTYPGEDINFGFAYLPISNGLFATLECGNNTTGNDCGFNDLIITEFGAIGENVIGTFSGESEFYTSNQAMVTLPYTASFKVKRE